MRKKFLICLLILLSFIVVGCTNNSSDTPADLPNDFETVEHDKVLKLYFNTEGEIGSEINPFIYGTFIEHMERIIYEGLWAEEIMDRKFVAPIGEDVSQWKKGSDKLITSDTQNTYCGGYAPHFIKGASMFQRGIVLHDAEYNGYIYAKGSGQLKVFLQATTGENVVKFVDIDSTDSFSKYEFSLITPVEGKYTLTYQAVDGEFYMDSVSLMKADNIYGMRKDTLDVLKELNAPFYRWPGGNFVSGYDFYDGIGDRDKRVSKRNLEYAGALEDFKNDSDRYASDLVNIENLGFYGVYEPNDFGIDEFIQMCRYLNAEPNIVLNAGLGTVQMAKDEVEYINGTSGYYASLRPQKEPYNVTYFSIGNEMNGDWQLGHMPLADYTEKHNAIAKAIKEVSPNIKIIAVGDNVSPWTQTMVNECKGNMDLTSEHFYAIREEESVRDHILSLQDQAEWRVREHRNLKNASDIKMSIDEYAYNQAKTSSRLKDGMGVASCLNVFIKNADVVEIACYSSTINATQGQIATDDLHAYLEGSGMVNALYSRYMQDYSINMSFNVKDFDDYIEVCATINKERNKITVSVINTSDYRLKISNSNIKNIISRSYMTSESFEGINSSDGQELIIVRDDTSANRCLVEPRSVTLIEFEIPSEQVTPETPGNQETPGTQETPGNQTGGETAEVVTDLILDEDRKYTGEVVDGIPNGDGTLTWVKTNCVYEGEFLDGVYHGEGSFYWNDLGDSLVGTWNNGNPVTGKYTYKNTMCYTGEFNTDWQFHGEGSFDWNTYNADGSVKAYGWLYEGEFQNGTIAGCTGKVTFTVARDGSNGDGVYWFEGEMDGFPNVKRNQTGKGKIKFGDSSIYEGDILYTQSSEWLRVGKGVMDFTNCTFTGDVAGGTPDSILVRYEGEFDHYKTGWMYGNGIMYFEDRMGRPSYYIKAFYSGVDAIKEYSGNQELYEGYDESMEREYLFN